MALTHFQTAAVILGYDLNLFRTLSKSEQSLTAEELYASQGAERRLLGERLTNPAKEPHLLPIVTKI